MIYLLEVKNLVKKYSSEPVLQDISFEIQSGEILGLVGANGAGKSTLMKSIMSLVPFDDGDILVDSESIKVKRESSLDKISCLIENPGFYPELTGYDHLKFIADLRKIPMTNLDSIIDFIDIGPKLKKSTKVYSLGMKQRLGIGIAILSAKNGLILDEPTNGLDQESIVKLKKLLAKCVEGGMWVLISSHTLSDLEDICHRFLFIDKGKLIDSNIKSDFEREIYLIDSEDNKKAYEAFKKVDAIKEVYMENDTLEVVVEKGQLTLIFNILKEEDISVNSIVPQSNSLKDKYFELYETKS